MLLSVGPLALISPRALIEYQWNGPVPIRMPPQLCKYKLGQLMNLGTFVMSRLNLQGPPRSFWYYCTVHLLVHAYRDEIRCQLEVLSDAILQK